MAFAMRLLLLAVIAPIQTAAQTSEPTAVKIDLPEIHALIIGIAEYPQIPEDLRPAYADHDAQAFYDALLKSPLVRSPGTMTVLPNSSAKRRDILEAIRTTGAAAGPDDVLYVFFSGYGLLDSRGRAFLMPYDADPEFPEDKGIRVENFVEQIAASTRSTHVVLLIDGSQHGSLASSVLSAVDTHFGDQDGNYVAMVSAGSGQRSFEDPNFESGLFTWYLIEALEGRADQAVTGNQDGIVTMRELYRNVVDNIEDRTERTFNEVQTPVISPGYDPLFLPINFAIDNDSMTAPVDDPERHMLRAARLEQAQDFHGASQAYARVLELDPNHQEARDRLAFVLEEHLFEYERAHTIMRYWVERDAADDEKLVRYAQSLFTTQRFEEHEAFVSGLLANEDFDEGLEVVLRALQIANFVAMDMEVRAFGSLAALVAELSRKDRAFELGWTFRGTINFIEGDPAVSDHKEWLVELFDTLENERGQDLINRIRAMR